MDSTNKTNDKKELKQYSIASNKKSIKFKGHLLLAKSSDDNNAFQNWSGQTGISEEIILYKSVNNNFVIDYEMFTRWQGSENKREIFVGKKLDVICDELKGYITENNPTSRCYKWFMQAIFENDLLEAEEV